MNFYYKKSCLIPQKKLQINFEQLISEIEKIKEELIDKCDSKYLFVSDKDNLKKINKVVQNKLNLKPSILVVIGIGGSNLGTVAVHEFLNGKLYNEQNPHLKIYFADNIDSDYTYSILNIVENELKNDRQVIINTVSKSGTTIETIANFELFLDLLKKYKKEKFKNYIVISTDKNSFLWNFANDIKCDVLEIPKNIGGRFSIFTCVSLFPLAMMNVNILDLLDGAKEITKNCLSEKIDQNFAGISASILFENYRKNIRIHDTFLFANDLEGIGKWYRQLLAESIGKELNLKEEKVEIGITPTISIGSLDLHSVGQLYLGGPSDKFTTFVSIENNLTNLKLPDFNEFKKIVQQKIEFKKIMNAIIKGTKNAYRKKSRPFCEIVLKEKSAKSIGQILQMKMFEILYLAKLFKIDAFDQPNVELYKNETRKILKN